MNTTTRRWGLFLDGQEREAAEGGSFAVTSPLDDAPVGVVAEATEADVARAVERARDAFDAWANEAPDVREAVLLRAADAVLADESTLADLLVDEGGSTITKARFEVKKAAQLLRTAAGEARRLYGDTFPNDRPHRLSFVLREPMGVVAAISPFNAPLALFAKMTVFALAAGNTVVGKPSEETPLVALRFAQLLTEAGLPPGVLQVVTGFPERCAVPLTRHPDVAAIAFTGSTGVGRLIAANAGRDLKRVQLELGGKNPVVVLRDYDPVRAAAQVAEGAFAHAGQICMASSRVLVEGPVLERFVEALVARAEALRLGDLRDESTAYGPLIHDAAVRQVTAQITEAVEGGGRLRTGGEPYEGRIFRPTVVEGPPRDSALWREETFGPVVSVVPVADLDQAVAIANDTRFGLSAGVLTNDLRRGLILARRIRAGAVHVGTHSFQTDALSPVGGVRDSGIGRSGGKYSVECFTELKWVSVELGG